MGEVWKARDTRVDRTVAVKFAQAGFSERFERESRAIAALNHPHICQLYDVGPDYLVMEFVDGDALRPPGDWRALLDRAIAIADGLAAAHAAGVVHRDLKPDNILVRRDGVLKILDFGLAKLSGDGLLQTRTMPMTGVGNIVGTVAYMSPEQATGRDIDARSDQFTFGLILYELASGKRPFATRRNRCRRTCPVRWLGSSSAAWPRIRRCATTPRGTCTASCPPFGSTSPRFPAPRCNRPCARPRAAAGCAMVR
jgi:serine/threonine protein kinase